jgi:hypothetical protein
VQQHARAVEHAGERARRVARKALRCRGNHRIAGRSGLTGEKAGALLVERGDDVGFDRVRAENGNEPRDARFVEDAVDRRWAVALRR